MLERIYKSVELLMVKHRLVHVTFVRFIFSVVHFIFVSLHFIPFAPEHSYISEYVFFFIASYYPFNLSMK